MVLPRAVLRWPFLIRASQILCCIVCLGGAGYIANADDAYLWGNGRNVTYLALFVALYGMLVSSLMIAAMLTNETLSRILPGLIDVINSGLATLFFIIIGAAAINVKPPWCTTAAEFTWSSITNSTALMHGSSSINGSSTDANILNSNIYNSSAFLDNSSSNSMDNATGSSSSSGHFGEPTCAAWDTVLVMGFLNALLYAICTVYAGIDMKHGKGLISVMDNGKIGPGTYHPGAAAAALGIGRWTPGGTAMPLQTAATAAAAGSSGGGAAGGGSDGGGARDTWHDGAAATAATPSTAAASADPFLRASNGSSGGGSGNRPATSPAGWGAQSPSSGVTMHDFSSYPAQPQSTAAAAGSGSGSNSWASRIQSAVAAGPAAAAAAMAPLSSAAFKLPVRPKTQQGMGGSSSSSDWGRQLLSSSPGAAAAVAAATPGRVDQSPLWQQQQQQLRHRVSSSSGTPAAMAAAAAATDRSEALIGTSMQDYWQYWYGGGAARHQQQQQQQQQDTQEQQPLQGSYSNAPAPQQQQQQNSTAVNALANGSNAFPWRQQQQQYQQPSNGSSTGQQQQQQRRLMTIEQFEAMQL